ncbi:response regulator [Paenibacillus yanchengensis]|uniref:Response regulator n=1 Tax=Paenibacillus yanchengensis TaxID=2035833 RepID=A0ABW4YNI1_9BACL
MSDFSLMIVDDEKIIRDGLQNSIDWKGLGFNLVALAADGEEALDLYSKYKPEAVIMDIHMPVMNGLEALAYFKKEHPATEIILLSGYDEFSYAQKAVKEGAFDYIIKLNMFFELEESLKKLHETLSQKHESNRQYDEFMSLKNDALFQNYIRGQRNSTDVTSTEDHYLYCVASVWLESTDRIFEAFYSSDFLPLRYLFKVTGPYIYFIFYIEKEKNNLFAELLDESFHVIEQYLKQEATVDFKIGVGDIKPRISDIPELYMEAMKATDYLRAGNDLKKEQSVLFYNDWKDEGKNKYNTLLETQWINWVYSGDDNNIIAWIKFVFAEAYQNKKIFVSHLRYLCIQIVAQFEKMTKTLISESVHINEIDSLIELESYIVQVLKMQCAIVQQTIQLQKNESISAVKKYVDGLYMTNLNLKDVARQFYFSSGYLSCMFKEYTGMTFSKYLITKRVETACILLTKTDMKIYEIAKEVGYTDEKHFSKLFSQTKNVGPREYRTLNKI